MLSYDETRSLPVNRRQDNRYGVRRQCNNAMRSVSRYPFIFARVSIQAELILRGILGRSRCAYRSHHQPPLKTSPK